MYIANLVYYNSIINNYNINNRLNMLVTLNIYEIKFRHIKQNTKLTRF